MPRSSSTTWESSPTKPSCSNAWPTGSSTRTRRCAPPATCIARNERGAHRALGLRHLGRPPDRAGAHRHARGSRHGQTVAARPRVLAAQAARRRSRHPQRTRRDLRRRPSGRTRGPRSQEPVESRPRRPPEPRRCVRPARRPDHRGGPHAVPGRRSGSAAQPPWTTWPIRSPASSVPTGHLRGRRRRRSPASPRGTAPPQRLRSWSSSTGSAASPRTVVST